MGRHRQLRGLVCLVVALSPAHSAAAVNQSVTGVPLPLSPTPAELSLVTDSYLRNANHLIWRDETGTQLAEGIRYGDYYAPPEFPQFVDGDAITLQGLFKWRREALDPVLDAVVPLGAFTPSCALAIEIVLVGGTCQPSLLWYNVADPASPTPPHLNQLYPITSGDLATELSCKQQTGAPKTDGFCPLAWDNRSPFDLSIEQWQKRVYSVDVRTDARYAGGAIAFAMRKGPGAISYCSDTVYSKLEHGVRSAANEPYVGTLMYASTAQPGSIYLAFEDSLMTPADWTNGGKTDGDFNDYVVHIDGCFTQTATPDGSGGAGAGGAGGADSDDAAGGASEAGGGNEGVPEGGASSGQSSGATAGASAASASGGDPSLGEGGADFSAHGGEGGAGRNGAVSGDAGGCGCRVARPSRVAWLMGGVLALGALARRRRAGRSR